MISYPAIAAFLLALLFLPACAPPAERTPGSRLGTAPSLPADPRTGIANRPPVSPDTGIKPPPAGRIDTGIDLKAMPR